MSADNINHTCIAGSANHEITQEGSRKVITHLVAAMAGAWTACIMAFAHDRALWHPWGISNGLEVFSGEYWSLFTSVFVHLDLMHIAFNLYWLVILGGWMEEKFGGKFYVVFMAFCALCASTTELSIAGDTGVGLSGVVYGIFGFLWGQRLLEREAGRIIDREKVVLFTGWLVVCFVLTSTHIMPVANSAHVTGLLFGLAAAWGTSRRTLPALMAAPSMIVAAIVVLNYSPWCTAWLAAKAQQSFDHRRTVQAVEYLDRILKMEPDAEWARALRAVAVNSPTAGGSGQ